MRVRGRVFWPPSALVRADGQASPLHARHPPYPSALLLPPSEWTFPSVSTPVMSVDGQSRYEVGMRLKDKIAIVVGAGQSPGEGLGNGRATVLRFAREGAQVLAVDNNFASAEETVAMARQSGGVGECAAFQADVTREATLKAMVEAARLKWGRVDILHYNVGVSLGGGDA